MSARRPPSAFVRSTMRAFSSAARIDIVMRSASGAKVPARLIVIAMHLGVEDPGHERRERPPRVALVSGRCLGFLEVAPEPVAGHLAEQVLLARVSAVERTDAHAGSRRDGRHRRVRVGREHVPGGLADARVVASGLGAPAAQWSLGRFHDWTG